MANNASLDVTLADVTLSAQAYGPNNVSLVQTLAPTSLSATGMLGRVFAFQGYLGEAKLSSHLTLGAIPDVLVIPPRLYNLTGPPRESGGAILCFVGPPWKTIEWRIVQGYGTLTPYTSYTDELGQAACRLDVGYVPQKMMIVVGVAYAP